MAWAAASTSPGSTTTYKTNPYETPTYGKSGGDWYSQNKERLDREAEETNRKHDEYMAQFRNKPAAAGPPPPPPEPPPKKPASAGPQPEAPDVGPAMMGLQQAVQGPTVGWADDPALQETAQGLGTRTPPNAMGMLSELVSKRGRMY